MCKGGVLGLIVHNADPLGRVITMRPATVSTAVAPRHKGTPLQKHGCAFVLPFSLSVSHSRGLERHHRVPIKPLVVEDSPDSLIYKYAHTHKYTSIQDLHMYCKYANVPSWQSQSIVYLTSLSAVKSLNCRIIFNFYLFPLSFVSIIAHWLFHLLGDLLIECTIQVQLLTAMLHMLTEIYTSIHQNKLQEKKRKVQSSTIIISIIMATVIKTNHRMLMILYNSSLIVKTGLRGWVVH